MAVKRSSNLVYIDRSREFRLQGCCGIEWRRSLLLGSMGDLRRFWTLQIIDFEGMPESRQKRYRLENLTEGCLDTRKGVVKCLRPLEHGKGI